MKSAGTTCAVAHRALTRERVERRLPDDRLAGHRGQVEQRARRRSSPTRHRPAAATRGRRGARAAPRSRPARPRRGRRAGRATARARRRGGRAREREGGNGGHRVPEPAAPQRGPIVRDACVPRCGPAAPAATAGLRRGRTQRPPERRGLQPCGGAGGLRAHARACAAARRTAATTAARPRRGRASRRRTRSAAIGRSTNRTITSVTGNTANLRRRVGRLPDCRPRAASLVCGGPASARYG